MDEKIAVIGLGYVGLPLCVALSNKTNVVGFDINERRISELKVGYDSTKEVTSENLKKSLRTNSINFTSDEVDLKDSNFYIVTVPTPVDSNNSPDVRPLISASKIIGKCLKLGDCVVYESTVFPGATEEICVPILEEASRLTANSDFTFGYSPERINPGDKINTLENVTKVVSGSNSDSLKRIENVYSSIIKKIYSASSVKVAEAAKVIENAQRDINIAFMNELSKIFHLEGIDTNEVLRAASSKWNFLSFSPGLVGGHCIGVDPYYLAHRAVSRGYNPEVILSGRRINDSMPKYVFDSVVKTFLERKINPLNAKILMCGITFKENCPDIRNSKLIELYHYLKDIVAQIDVFDPVADKESLYDEFQINLVDLEKDKLLNNHYDLVVIGVNHREFEVNFFQDLKRPSLIIFDLKCLLQKHQSDFRL